MALINSTTEHSWYNLPIHIVRGSSGKIVRATCGKLCILSEEIGMYVNFTENGRKRHKIVSPIFLSSIYKFWLNHDVVSDDDDDGAEVSSSIVLLTVTDTTLSKQKTVQWVVNQTNQILQIK